ncbi:uncharacterized protein LOC115884480 [Sitophilus oryzae]|uniref:Uncharacterized protein LOC115884480 n=1 Tax=Sitophilus oryzae TaxID=7048 RepID=A0A6J2Y7I8_SITOR|nr:uncharacterized protein LOC115884480 [Sitophilus oryzae]
MGIPINEEHFLILNFADDQAVFAQDSFDMEFMLRRLYTQYREWGLEVSLEKTEYLVLNSDAKFDILIDDKAEIQQVDTFKYVGAIVDKNGIGGIEIKQRIQNARRVYHSPLNSIWWDKHINIKHKKHIGQTMVESVLCYGSMIWALREEDKRRIMAVEMDYLRRSARVSRLQRVRNEEIKNRTSAQETVIQRIKKRGLRWFGHLMRMEDTRWPKRVFK